MFHCCAIQLKVERSAKKGCVIDAHRNKIHNCYHFHRPPNYRITRSFVKYDSTRLIKRKKWKKNVGKLSIIFANNRLYWLWSLGASHCSPQSEDLCIINYFQHLGVRLLTWWIRSSVRIPIWPFAKQDATINYDADHFATRFRERRWHQFTPRLYLRKKIKNRL